MNRSTPIRNFFLLGAMLLSATLAFLMHPKKLHIPAGQEISLENMVPKTFDGWRVDESIPQVLPDPQLLKTVRETYSQTLSRSYVNQKGQRIMLSIAYGGTGKEMQFHRPDVCYPAQGFEILSTGHGVLKTSLGVIPIYRMSTRNRNRYEPVTYWVVMGGLRTRYGLSMRMVQLKNGLTGRIPEGMLVRFSSLGNDSESEYLVQDNFAKALLQSMSPEDASRLAGKEE